MLFIVLYECVGHLNRQSAFIPFAVFIRFAGGAIFVFVITCDDERSLFPRAGLDASASAQAS
jgi:hypothetical protein